MIKFFRNIRKRLLSEGKTAQYIKYAIGEIVLVVIGILIALKINNWNEARKNSNKEKAILKELHNEFKANLTQFEEAKNVHQKSFQAAEIVIRNLNRPETPESQDSLREYGSKVFSNITFNPSNGVVQSLISSGDFQLIQNDSLRRHLVSWRETLDDYTEEEVALKNFWTDKVEPYFMENGDFLNPFNIKNFELLKDPLFRNMIARHRFYVDNVLSDPDVENSLHEIVRLSKTD
ncbi:DUF6090 family protein [Allomuricauda sp. d1]|uniref:DUF6090 family protein n=1 Tax=Allomuricauda sp. d1 TaxID=3136725 RepID=UPI0031D01B60